MIYIHFRKASKGIIVVNPAITHMLDQTEINWHVNSICTHFVPFYAVHFFCFMCIYTPISHNIKTSEVNNIEYIVIMAFVKGWDI